MSRERKALRSSGNSGSLEGDDVAVLGSGDLQLGVADLLDGSADTVSAAVKLGTPALSAKGTAYKTITLTWKSVACSDGYELYRSKSKNGIYSLIKTFDKSTLSYKNTGVVTGSRYYYKIRAFKNYGDEKGFGAFSTVVSGKAVPPAPSAKAKSASYNSVKISWKAINGADGYVIYRSSSKNGAFSRLKAVGKDELSYVDGGLTCGKAYYYKVKAYTLAEGKKISGPFSAAKGAKPVLGAAQGFKASAGEGSVSLSWAKTAGASGYRVYRAASKGGTYKLISDQTKRSFIDAQLKTGKTYYYKVRAYRVVEKKNVFGAYSAVKNAKVK